MSGVRTTSGLKDIVRMRIRNTSNVLKSVSRVRIRDASGVLRTFAGSGQMTAVASPAVVAGYGYSHASIPVTTTASDAVPSGGVPPYTYLWASVSGSFSPVNPTAFSTIFRSPNLVPGNTASGTLSCKVTDSLGNFTYTNTVEAYAENNGPV